MVVVVVVAAADVVAATAVDSADKFSISGIF